MTRYTNVSRKRTYVQAGFAGHQESEINEGPLPSEGITSFGESALLPLERATSMSVTTKRQRQSTEPRNAGITSPGSAVECADNLPRPAAASGQDLEGAESMNSDSPRTNAKGIRKAQRPPRDADARKFASERRRLKRQDQRHADTVCFACRETGHAARDCRRPVPSVGGVETNVSGKRKQNKSVVGICYRCGSRRHNLSKCPKPVDPSNSLPFASCFVCSGTGHLAGSCPENKEKGVYPNGGNCKLCGQTAHLAKDCHLRNQEVASAQLFVGTGQKVGADEDDFHSFKRQAAEVNRYEKSEDRFRRKQGVKQGAHSGVVKAFGPTSVVKPGKVVTF